MTMKNIFYMIEEGSANSKNPEKILFGFQLKSRERTRDTIMDNPKNQIPDSSVTISMLISETVYKLVVVIERMIRWFTKAVLRPYLFLFRCLIW